MPFHFAKAMNSPSCLNTSIAGSSRHTRISNEASGKLGKTPQSVVPPSNNTFRHPYAFHLAEPGSPVQAIQAEVRPTGGDEPAHWIVIDANDKVGRCRDGIQLGRGRLGSWPSQSPRRPHG